MDEDDDEDDDDELSPISELATVKGALTRGALAKYDAVFGFILAPSLTVFSFANLPSTAEIVAVNLAPAFDLAVLAPRYLISSSSNDFIVTSATARLTFLRRLCHTVQSVPTLSVDGGLVSRNDLCSSVVWVIM